MFTSDKSRWIVPVVWLLLLGIVNSFFMISGNPSSWPPLPSPGLEMGVDQFVPIHEQDHQYFFLISQAANRSLWSFDLRTGQLHPVPVSLTQAEKRQPRDTLQSLLLQRAAGGTGELNRQILSLSPDRSAYVWAGKNTKNQWSLYLYKTGQAQNVPLTDQVEPEALSSSTFIQWSADQKYLLVNGQRVIRLPDGWTSFLLNGSRGVWSPRRSDLLYVDQEGKLQLFNPDSGEQHTMYVTGKDETVMGHPVWDPDGYYFSFVTRVRMGEKCLQRIHVMDTRLFHYVEQEITAKPELVSSLTLSKNGKFLTYILDGRLKIVNLDTQESRVYDGFVRKQTKGLPYFCPDLNGIWLVRNHRILFVSDQFEEREVYKTSRQLLGFRLTYDRKRAIVHESDSRGQWIRLVHLPPQLQSDAAE
ncbi:hypothetical protein [Lihuaxuella thermophila]|uniref:Uncharacterized protein n=1 Tax=Lihuaxuella thermophila TaxID=1173111 RepID=A0A1H8IYD9_9BACL|nr:hypothetical protein [Lihuaxuella thermophila]SEN73522.1 hypothetical protein SAMN05444955_12029 [Lihuaxuella thermophila]